MYVDRLILKPVTNREDFVITVGIYDDDTGQPVDLQTYIPPTTLVSDTGDTLITDEGVILTFSGDPFSPLAIPSQPFAVADSGTTLGLQFEIRSIPPRHASAGYITWVDYAYSDNEPILRASLGSGITIIDIGIIQIEIMESIFRSLTAGTYSVALTLTDGFRTRQLFVGTLPVYWGGVST